MKIGPFEVDIEIGRPTCGECGRDALMTVDGTPQCTMHAGFRFQSDPEVLGELVLHLLMRHIGSELVEEAA